jgi:hypothetical protein
MWREIWGRIVHLKNLSGAVWDKDTRTIRLSDENYTGHCNVRLLYECWINYLRGRPQELAIGST